VAVRVLADAVVVEQTMAVAEVDAFGDRVHSDYRTSQIPNPNSQ
jgi:hypothetical protein